MSILISHTFVVYCTLVPTLRHLNTHPCFIAFFLCGFDFIANATDSEKDHSAETAHHIERA
jgi:hypothetical protein